MKSLLFHDIVSNSQSPGEDFYSITVENFRNILNYLKNKSFKVVSYLDTINKRMAYKKDILVISFDDGFASNYEYALPILKTQGFRATFFITTNFVGKKQYLTWDLIKFLSEEGMEIGSHSCSHSNLVSSSTSEAERELDYSKKLLEDKLGIEILGFSFPGGCYNNRLLNLAFKVGYKYVATSDFRYDIKLENNSYIFGRYAINSSISLKNIEEYLNDNQIFKYKYRLFFFLKESLKKLIGTQKYLYLRRFVFKKFKNGVKY